MAQSKKAVDSMPLVLDGGVPPWVYGEVFVPPFSVVQAPSWLGFAVNVTGGSCRGLNIEELLLTQTVADADHLKIGLQADVGTHCVVDTLLEVRSLHSCTVAVALSASVVKLTIQVPSVSGFPGQATAVCELTPDVTQLEVHGESAACDALKLAKRGIRALVNEFASKVVCSQVSAGLAKLSSEEKVQPYLKPAAALRPPAADGAVDLRSIFWQGPMGHVFRSFLREVGHVDNNVEFNKVLQFLRSDLGLGALALHSGAELKVALPWIEDAFLAWTTKSAKVDVSFVEDLHFGFTAPSAARLEGEFTPWVSMAAEMALLLPQGTATLKLLGHVLNITQHASLSPVHFHVRADLKVAGDATVFVAYNETGLRQLQLDQMQSGGCASIFLDRRIGSPIEVLEARCTPRLQSLDVQLLEYDPSDLENRILKVFLTVLQLLGHTFGDTAVQAVDGYISRRGRALMNEMLEQMILKSQQLACPASNYSSGEIGAIAMPSSWGSGFFLSLMAILFLVYLYPLCTCYMSNCAPERSTSSSRLNWLNEAALAASPDFAEVSRSMDAGPRRGLGWQPGVPLAARWGLLSGIVGTILLFVYASVTPGILLSGSFKASDGSSDTRHMASLSMDNSLVQTWTVGSYFVFCAMLIFSVIWPYIKLFMMLYVWVRPMDHSTRGPVLVFLDQIGKWSLMDNIIMFLFIVFFWIAWTGEDLVGGGRASFGLKCSPQDEVNTFLAATILSLLLGHAMLWIHRWQNADKVAGGEEPLARSGPSSSRRLRIVGVGHVICLLLTVLSWQVEIVEVTFSGLVGTFLEVTQQPTSRGYSIIGILSCLGEQGSMYLQVTFAVFVLAIPVLQLLAMIFICLYQLRPKRQQQFLRLCYTLRAWAAYDVFLIAFLAAVLGGDRYGIGQFIELIVYKQNLAPTCRGFRDVGIECLHIHLGFLPGTLIIVAAVALSYVVSLLVARETNPG
ncbi:ytlA [Symbiodinium natans]|uniref:YtlA protein n=1 Tax=Symbiodinium natans TaxID=878477 RepID=A0A812I810_9DINO|nr:ytlA [Symbiodinium natans]